MAKKSYKRPARPKNDNAGCMWGLISLFDFRQGHSPRKLLSDRKNGSDTSVGNGYSKVQLEELNKLTNNVDGSRSGRVNLGMSSVKRLMEEEMSQEHPQRRILRDEVQSMISELGSEVQLRKNHKQRNKKNKLTSDVHAEQLTASVSLENHHSEIINPTERPSFNFDLASLLVEFYRYGNRCQETVDVSNNVINLYITLKTICETLQNQLDDPEPRPDQRYPILRRALADVAEAIVSQNSVNEKQIVGQTYIQSKEVLDALQVLNSNRELILKLFQDSDSLLFKHIQDYQSSRIGKLSDERKENIRLLEEENGSPEKCGESDSNKALQKQRKSSFFWKKDKIKGTQPSKEGPSSHSFSRIVVLKPDPSRIQNSPIATVANSSPQSHHNLGFEEDGERVVSYFSLSEIKKRLKRVFRERKREQHIISMDGVLHKIPIGYKDPSVTGKQIHNESAPVSSARKSSADSEKPSYTLASVDKKGKKPKPEEYKHTIKDDDASSMPEYVIYTEAKRHIVELLGAVDQTDNLPEGHVSRSLGRLLSFPEYNVSLSPRSSLQAQQEISSSSEGAECSHVEKIQPEETINIIGPSSQNLGDSFCSGGDLNDRVKKIDPESEIIGNNVEEESDFDNEGSLGTVEEENIISELVSHHLEPLSELSEESDGKNKRCAEESSSPSVMLDSSEANSENTTQADLSGDVLAVDNSFVAENTIEGLEKLSPVSVLHTIYSEDITNPDYTDMDHCKLQVQKSNVDDNDNPLRALTSLSGEVIRTCSDESQARSQYIKAVLKASGLTGNVLSESWFLEDQLLDSSLFDEVETSCFPPQEDEKLLFDCIKEVLVEIQERFYNCSLNLSFIRSSIRPAPSGEKLIKEVTKGVERRITTHSSKSVDEIIRTDLDKEAWIDLRLETENIVIDIWCTVIDDLLEETVFDLWF